LPNFYFDSIPGGEPPWLLFEFMDYGDLATLLRTLSPDRHGVKTSFLQSQEEEGDADSGIQLPHLTTVSLDGLEGDCKKNNKRTKEPVSNQCEPQELGPFLFALKKRKGKPE